MVVGKRHRILRRTGPLCRARYAIEKTELLSVFGSQAKARKAIRRQSRYSEMTSAVLLVLLAVGISVCVFVVVWWLLGKL